MEVNKTLFMITSLPDDEFGLIGCFSYYHKSRRNKNLVMNNPQNAEDFILLLWIKKAKNLVKSQISS
jgi:hypothetical protein